MTVPLPPPTLARDLRHGTRLVAGLGHSTVLASMDCETYSEAGFEWSEERQRWVQPAGASGTAKGLPLVGAAVYAQHPSTEVLCMAYNLKDGTGPKLWHPGMPAPADLFAYLAAGGLIEAWNAPFEGWIWNEVCTRLYGWPELPLHQLRCAMAKARAWGLPGSLENAARVLGVPVQKDKDGKRLLDKFSVPRNPTKADPRRRIRPEDDPEDAKRLYGYCLTDIDAEDEVAARVPDLEGEELEFWLADQAINKRGAHIDLAGVENCCAIVDAALERYNAELRTLTGGVVERASEVQKLTGWLGAHGVHMATMDEDAVAEALKSLGDHHGVARRALEIRQAVGSASVKKVYSMRLKCARGGRIHDLFSYHAARTGRPTGNNPQPTNMPKAGPDVVRCGHDGRTKHAVGCGRYHGSHLSKCPWCGVMGPPGRKAEWCVEAAEDALEVISWRSLSLLEHYFGDAMLAVSGSLRGLFDATPGRHLVSSDFTAIEAVVIAALAGETWRMDVFRANTDIYLESISRSTGVAVQEMLDFKARTGMHHELRQSGKVTELACFTAQTQVLTSNGYKGIVDVSTEDQVWDGKNWVSHLGVVSKGLREVIDLDGIETTPQHLVLLSDSWKEARLLASNASMLSQALATGSATLPSRGLLTVEGRVPTWKFNATVVRNLISRPFTISVEALRRVATRVLLKPPAQPARCFTNMPPWCPMLSTADDFSTVWPLVRIDVITQRPPGMRTTVDEASTCGPSGSATKLRFLPTWSLLKGGTTHLWTWIASTWTKATSPVTYASSPAARTATTNAPSRNSRSASSSLKPVYDIAFAGPLNRFTVKSNSGHLIVHNCGFGGWIGAMKAMYAQLGIELDKTDDQLKSDLLAWRKASPAIVEMWGGQTRDFGRSPPDYFGLEGASVLAMLNPGVRQHVKRLDGSDVGASYLLHGHTLYLTLPSGRHIAYQNPRLTATGTWRGYRLTYEGWNTNPKKGTPGWITRDLYGGLNAENLVQALARDIQRRAILNCERADLPVVLHVYDEDVADCGLDRTVEELEACMMDVPDWAREWPIKAAGGWSGRRYRKA